MVFNRKRLLVGALCLILFIRGIIYFQTAHAVSFVDSEGYKAVYDMLVQGQFADTRSEFRGQTFPILWLMADTLGIKYQVFAFCLSFLAALVLALTFTRLFQRAGPVFLLVGLFLASSNAVLDFVTTYLTESLTFPALVLWLASCYALYFEPCRHWRSMLMKVLAFAVITAVLNALKAWYLILPLGFLAGVFCLSSLLAWKTHNERLKKIALLCLASGALGWVLAKSIYSPSLHHSPARQNMGSFIRTYRTDLFLSQRLQDSAFEPARQESLEAALKQAQTCLADDQSGCGHSPFDRILETFQAAYLKDVPGVIELLRIGFQRAFRNFYDGESSMTHYGSIRVAGHDGLVRFGPVLAVLMSLIPIILLLRLIRLLALSRRIRSTTPSFALAEREIFILSVGVPCLVLALFMGIGSGGLEPGRVEQPGYLALLMFLPMIVSRVNKKAALHGPQA